MYPGSRELLILPTEVTLGWVSESEDGVFHDAARKMTLKLGMVGASRYPNYAMYGTSVADMYGEEGLKRTQDTRARVDPDGVMQLTGGFKVVKCFDFGLSSVCLDQFRTVWTSIALISLSFQDQPLDDGPRQGPEHI